MPDLDYGIGQEKKSHGNSSMACWLTQAFQECNFYFSPISWGEIS